MAALMPVDEALARLLDGLSPGPAEEVDLRGAALRVLAEPLHARRDQPPFDASAMDGYAIRAADVASAPVRLRVIGESAAGHRFAGRLGPGEAVRISTGAPVPEEADTILLQEDATRIDGGTVEARETVAPDRHIRRAGLDFRRGDILLEAGRVLDPAALTLAAAGNHARLAVIERPGLVILMTGDELVAPGREPGPDQIVASNGFGVAAIAEGAGGHVRDLVTVGDERAAIEAAVRRALDGGARILVTIGGASVGDHDLVREVLLGMGMELGFWKIAMRPGKPLMSGRLGDVHVLGLPGNPVSALVCAHLFLVPMVARMAGRPDPDRLREGVLATPMAANRERQDYVRARAVPGSAGLTVTPFALQDSSMTSVLAGANCLIVRPPHAAKALPGDACCVLMLR